MRNFLILFVVFFFAFTSICYGGSIKEEYMASCKTVGSQDKDIYTKALMKNPDKYATQNVYIRGKIAKIEEAEGFTAMYLFINQDYDIAVVTYIGEVDVYDNDWVDTYGIVNGRIDGVNGLGVPTTWPHVSAQFVDQVQR